MKKENPCVATMSMFCMTTVLMLVAPFALAQEAKTPSPEIPASVQVSSPKPQQQGGETMNAEATEFDYEPLQVGDATQSLLAWQRDGAIASATSRPIAGAVANRSYERYLKSFEFQIPERMSSSVKSTSSGSGSSGK